MRNSEPALYLLLSLLFSLVLGVLQHLFFPQVKEVGGVCVEFKRVLLVIPTVMNTEKIITTYVNLHKEESMHCSCLGGIKDTAVFL